MLIAMQLSLITRLTMIDKGNSVSEKHFYLHFSLLDNRFLLISACYGALLSVVAIIIHVFRKRLRKLLNILQFRFSKLKIEANSCEERLILNYLVYYTFRNNVKMLRFKST